MTDEEQRRIFSRNLNNYILNSGKQQKEVAKDLGIPNTTFNSWCVGRIIPQTGKKAVCTAIKGIKKCAFFPISNIRHNTSL